MVLESLDKDLVLYLPMSEGSGSKVFDRSNCQNNGTISGAIFVKPYEDMSDDSEDEGDDPEVIYDDDETFWTLVNWGVGSIQAAVSEETTIVKKGSSSEKIVSGAGANLRFYLQHAYGGAQDFSKYDYITLWFYGANSGATFTLEMTHDLANFNFYSFTDNFSGWKRFFFPLERPTNIQGTGADITQVSTIRFSIGTDNQQGTWYLDRTTVDVGNWRFGEVLDFDGTDDYVLTGTNPFTLVQEFTVNIWAMRFGASADGYAVLFSIDGSNWSSAGGFMLFEQNSVVRGRVRNAVEGNEGTATLATITDKVPYMFTVVWNRPTLKVYLNGKLVTTATYDYDVLWTDFGVSIGRWGLTSADGRWNGWLDEPRIYCRELTPQEIRALYLQSSRRG